MVHVRFDHAIPAASPPLQATFLADKVRTAARRALAPSQKVESGGIEATRAPSLTRRSAPFPGFPQPYKASSLNPFL